MRTAASVVAAAGDGVATRMVLMMVDETIDRTGRSRSEFVCQQAAMARRRGSVQRGCARRRGELYGIGVHDDAAACAGVRDEVACCKSVHRAVWGTYNSACLQIEGMPRVTLLQESSSSRSRAQDLVAL